MRAAATPSTPTASCTLPATGAARAHSRSGSSRAYLTEAEPIGDPETLVRLAAEVGLDVDEGRVVLAGDAYADAVRRDERLASGLGATGVPFFVFGRAAAVGGAVAGAVARSPRARLGHDGRGRIAGE